MATIKEMNLHYVLKWLDEANEKDITIFTMIGMAQDASTDIFAKKQLADKLRDMADKILNNE